MFENEEKMTEHKMWSCMISGFIAGVIGGALGLGGAIILVPVWLNSGVEKVEATSSSAPLILFSAGISFFIALLGQSYSNFFMPVFYLVLAFVGALVVRSTLFN